MRINSIWIAQIGIRITGIVWQKRKEYTLFGHLVVTVWLAICYSGRKNVVFLNGEQNSEGYIKTLNSELLKLPVTSDL